VLLLKPQLHATGPSVLLVRCIKLEQISAVSSMCEATGSARPLHESGNVMHTYVWCPEH
jgi:hypothetical protein